MSSWYANAKIQHPIPPCQVFATLFCKVSRGWQTVKSGHKWAYKEKCGQRGVMIA